MIKSNLVFDMEVTEKNLMESIFEDVEIIKWKVDGIENILETLVEMYNDVFYDVKDEYVEKLEQIRKEGEFEASSSVMDLRRSIEND